MTEPLAPVVDCEQYHAALPVSDVLAAVTFYTEKLGFMFSFVWGDPPAMAAVNLGEIQIFFEHGTPKPKGCALLRGRQR